MFSEALKIADRNTVKYMIEELQDRATQAEEKQKLAEENQRQEAQKRKQAEENQKLTEAELQRSQEEVAQLKALLAQKQ